jgi:CelD/BcsL family acetyltransferase involved in cellulose biosynthesis
MQISVIRPHELGPDEISVWHSMQRKTESLVNPFLCPEFAVAVDSFCPDARVAVLADGAEIIGFFPFQKRRLGVGLPIGAGLNDCQGLIHAPDVDWDPQELLRACKVSVWQFDHLVNGQLPFERYAVTVASSPVINLTEGFTAYWKNLQMNSPKFYRNVVRRTRKLEREAGELRFVMDSRDSAGLRMLINWKSDQYRRTKWIDRFERPWVVDLVDYLFGIHNEWFGGLLSLLYAGETLVAGHFGLRAGHILAAWFPSYNTQFSSQSPGLIHHIRMAENAAALGIHQIDLGKGTEPYKETLKNHHLFVAEGSVARGPLLAAAHRVRSDAVRWAGPQIRQHPLLFRAVDQLLRHSGRIG